MDIPIDTRDVFDEVEIEQGTDPISAIMEEMKPKQPETYAEYNFLSVEDKVKLFAILDGTDVLRVFETVQRYFKEINHSSSFNEIMDEANQIYDAVRQIRIRIEEDRICSELQNQGLTYSYISAIDKARLFAFQMDDNNYNLALHSAVLNKLGDRMDFDERYEDYQKIYEVNLRDRGRNVGKGRER